MSIPLWQKLCSIIVYLIPWSEVIPFGSHLLNQYMFLQLTIQPAIPILLITKFLPFGSLIIFLTLFLGVIRNQQMPYFLRFNVLQALLLDIGLIIIGYLFQILFTPFASSLIIRTFSSLVFIAMLAIVLFSIYECINNREPDIPGISNAVRIQL